MFCDLADSTSLSGRLDPEDLRELIRAYQQAASVMIQRFDGHVAQYLVFSCISAIRPPMKTTPTVRSAPGWESWRVSTN